MQNQSDSGMTKRTFRLSFIELASLVLALIAMCGLLVMLVLQQPEQSGSSGYVPPEARQLEKALAASEKVQAGLDALRDEVNQLRKQVEEELYAPDPNQGVAPPSDGAGKASPALARKIAKLEESLNNLDKAIKPATLAGERNAKEIEAIKRKSAAAEAKAQTPDPALTDKIAELEQALAKLDKTIQPLSQADEKNAKEIEALKLTRSEANSESGKPDPTLVAKVLELEKSLGALDKAMKPMGLASAENAKEIEAVKKAQADAVSQPAKADPALIQKVAQLEKSLAKLDKAIKPLQKQGRQNANLVADIKKLQAKIDQAVAPVSKASKDNAKQIKALQQAQASTGGAYEAESQRIQGLSEMLDRVSDTVAKSKTALPAINKRLTKLEKAGASSSKAAISQQQLRRMVTTAMNDELRITREKARWSAKELPGVLKRVAKLEENQQAYIFARRVQAPVPDPHISERISELEKEISSYKNDADRIYAKQALIAQRAINRELSQRLAKLETTKPSKQVTATTTTDQAQPESQDGRKMVVHKVLKGQTLYSISRRYGVKVSQLRAWNPQLAKRNTLYIDEKLVVYVSGKS